MKFTEYWIYKHTIQLELFLMIYRFNLDMKVKTKINWAEKFILLGYMEPFRPTAFQYLM